MTLVVPFEDVFKEQTKLLAKHESWERVELGEVCEVLNGFAFKSSLFNSSEGFPIIRIRDLARGKTETFYKGDYPENYVIENGDLLVGMDGNFACYEWKGGTALLNQRVCKLIPRENYMHTRFLLFGINGYLKAIQEATSSVTVGHLSSRDIQRIPFPLPPLNEQRRIVAKLEKLLSRVDAAQARLAEVPRILKRFRQSVLAAACSGKLTVDWREKNPEIEPASRRWRLNLSPIHNEDYPELPETWVYRTLDNISLRVSVGHVGTTSQFYCEPSEGIAFLRSQNVRPMRLDLSGVAYITKEFHKTLKKSQLQAGDLLIVRVGANRGDTCVVTSGLGEINCANIIFARPFEGISDYLNIYFQTPFCQKMLEGLTTGSAQGVINTKVVAEVPVPIPPLAEQQEIVRRVEALFKTADALEARYRTAKEHVDKLAQSILARAFRGELVITEAELARREGRDYEPASLLLRRIRQQRAEQQQQAAPRQKSKPRGRAPKRAAASPKLFT